jgi:hypothetical protein
MARLPSADITRWRCYHEAGHAVTVTAFGFAVEKVTIVPEDEAFGSCQLADFHLHTRRDQRNFAIVCVAGTVAQYLAGGPHVRESNDYGRIPASRRAIRDRIEALARWWLCRRWRDVERVAEALARERTLIGGQVRALVPRIDPVGPRDEVSALEADRPWCRSRSCCFSWPRSARRRPSARGCCAH